jgi:serine/threonine-protein kinase
VTLKRATWDPVERYQPCFEIASGGMATVFLARSANGSGFHRFVALKRIHPHLLADRAFTEMFVDEVRVVSRIVHPNVCSVFDYEAEGDQFYIVMEYLMGEPASRIVKAMRRQTHPPTVDRACALVARIIADACEGLHAAHELPDSIGDPLGVVHRDISPQNLFVTYDGAVKVVDFGLVRTANSQHKTKTGVLKGKFAYLPPEAIAMKPLDRRADVWGLGVVLWELITMKTLFSTVNDVDTLMAVSNAAITPPSTVRPGVPPALDAIVLRALARNPDERYATARELAQDLVAFIHAGDHPVGLADLAQWMDKLFPGGRARKLSLLEIAAQLEDPRSPASASGTTPPRDSTGSARARTPASERASPAPPSEREGRSRSARSDECTRTDETNVLVDGKTRIVARTPRGLIRRMARRKPRRRAPLTAVWIGLALMTGAIVLVVSPHRSSGLDKPMASESVGMALSTSVPLTCGAQPTPGYVLEVAPGDSDTQRVMLRLRPLTNGAASP